MAKLQHFFNGQVQREYIINERTAIGRSQNNDICIDNLGISFFHAKILRENKTYFLEDLGSTNGTFVDGLRIDMHILENDQIITLGKHYLKFTIAADSTGVNATPARSPANQTMMASPSKNMADVVRAHKTHDSPEQHQTMTAFLITEEKQNLAINGMFVIGKEKDAHFRLKGWFTPKVVTIINHKSDGLYITPFDHGKITVNGKKIVQLQKLNNGDIVIVRGTRFQVYLRYKR